MALQDFQRRRLAGAVGADQAEDLALLHAEVDALNGLQIAVKLAQAAHLDRQLFHKPIVARGMNSGSGVQRRTTWAVLHSSRREHICAQAA